VQEKAGADQRHPGHDSNRALTVYDALNLLKTADIAAGMSLEVLLASNIELDEKIHAVRPHPARLSAPII